MQHVRYEPCLNLSMVVFRSTVLQDGGQCQKNIGSPVDTPVDTASRMQKDMAILREEKNHVLRTPAASRSNGWDNDTAALQLFSHLEGDALNAAHLVPLARRLSRSGLVDALTAHYGSPGQLADSLNEPPEHSGKTRKTALETLAVKAFGDMEQTARLRLIRDRFMAGHSNCDLRRHLDSGDPNQRPMPCLGKSRRPSSPPDG